MFMAGRLMRERHSINHLRREKEHTECESKKPKKKNTVVRAHRTINTHIYNSYDFYYNVSSFFGVSQCINIYIFDIRLLCT